MNPPTFNLSVTDGYPFASESVPLLLAALGRQLAVRPDDAPPRQADARGQHIPYRPGGSRVTGAASDLAVTSHLAAPEVAYHGANCVCE